MGKGGYMGVAVVLATAGMVCAQDISFTPENGPGILSEAFEQVLPGGVHSTEYIAFGVDFTGYSVAAYSGPPAAWSFVDGDGILSLNEFVGGRIVVPGTTKPGTTDLIWVEADLAEDAGHVRLACWDSMGKFLGSTFADDGVGEDGDLIAKFEHPGIASFMLLEHHDGHEHEEEFFGVRRIHLNTPVPAPGPAALGVAGLGLVPRPGRGRRVRLES